MSLGSKNSRAWPDRPDHRGLTRLTGHTLLEEGSPLFEASGGYAYHSTPKSQRYGKCQCGAVFGPGISRNAIKRAHSTHKDEIRSQNA